MFTYKVQFYKFNWGSKNTKSKWISKIQSQFSTKTEAFAGLK